MDPALPDARLSRYRIERLPGAGGMGSVYLSHDPSLDRPVAIKFIAEDKAGDADARRCLLREGASREKRWRVRFKGRNATRRPRSLQGDTTWRFYSISDHPGRA